MEKHDILNIIHCAIVEVSPCAAEYLAKKNSDRKQDIFFVDLGINSIDYAEIAHFVMGKLNIDFPLDIFTRTNRLDDVVEIFYDLTSIEA
ncbi:MAG: phosphopantetheine-binding protein [Pseudomonadota bacterium]